MFSKDIFKTESILPLSLLVILWVCWGGCSGVSRTLSLCSCSPWTHPLQSPYLWLDLLRSVGAPLVPMDLFVAFLASLWEFPGKTPMKAKTT